MRQTTTDGRRIVQAPCPPDGYHSTTGVVSVTLSDDEEVEWIYSPDGKSVIGYTVKKKNDLPLGSLKGEDVDSTIEITYSPNEWEKSPYSGMTTFDSVDFSAKHVTIETLPDNKNNAMKPAIAIVTQIEDVKGEAVDSYKPVCVTWNDATHVSGWHSETQIQEVVDDGLLKQETLGWLVDENDSFISLAMTVGQYKAADILKIPRNMIVEILGLSTDGKDVTV